MSQRLAPAHWLFALLAALAPVPAAAQIDTGTIVGRVQDATGAALPGVTVTATRQGTGVIASAETNASGEFVFPGLRIGTYAVAAELEGFKKTSYEAVRVNVQDRVRLDFELGVGTLTESVTVTGRAELLQTQSADIGSVVDERQVRDLPLLGRRYSELAFLVPGVVVAPAGITSRGEDSFFNANGNYATWNNYTLDGADNNSFSTNLQERSPQVVQPPVDALQEFKVQTRTYSAEFGKAAGAVINASIKQGTNAFRGSAYEFFRDEAFNANTWDNNRAGRPKGQFNQHIAGFTLGGPVMRNRTFFFGDYQATRTERALSQTATVPTARMRAGDLSELTGAVVAGNPFVPAGLLGHRHPPRRRVVHRPGGGAPRPALPAAQRARRRLLQQQLHLQRPPRERHQPVRPAPRPQRRRRPRQPVRALQLPADRPGRAADPERPGGLGRFRQRLPDPRSERRRRLVARLRRQRVQRVPRRLQPGPLRRRASRVRHRRERRVRHHRRAQGRPVLRRAAAHADHPLRAARRAVLPAAVPDLAGVPVRREPDLDQGHARDEVRRRAPSRSRDLHRPAVVERRAVVQRRALHRPRPRRLPARAVERAAAHALPRAGSLRRRLAVLRAGQLAGARRPDGHRRPALRALHPALRSQRPAHQHRAGDRAGDPGQRRIDVRAHARPPRHQRPRATGRRVVESDAPAGASRRLRRVLPAGRPLRQREPARVEPAAAGRRGDQRQLRRRSPGLQVLPGLHAAQSQHREPVGGAVAHPGSEPGHAGRAPVQHRAGVPADQHDGRRGRVRGQPHPQRPAPAQPQPGGHPA